MNCEICGEIFENKNKIYRHIRIHEIRSKEYYDKYLKKENEDLCIICNSKTRYNGFNKGYKKYCSIKCGRNDKYIKEKIRKTNIEKYGCENPGQNNKIKEKIKKTNVERYGVENPFQSEEIKEKIKEINLNKYGCEYPIQNKEVFKKVKQTNLKKYGVEYISQSEEIKENIKYKNLYKYSVDNIFKSEEIKEKIKQTNLEKYGVEYISQSEEIKEKIKQNNLEKYRVEYISQSEEIKEKIKQTNLEKYGVENVSQNKEIKEKIKNNFLKNRLDHIKDILKYNNLEILSKYNNNRELIKLKCLKCNTIFETQYFYIQQGYGKCNNCFPKYKSNGEIELLEFIKSIEIYEIIENLRDIIKPYELDICVPDKNIAIEFNGLYWHSETKGKDKYYHLNKTELCLKQNIRLIHIFEDEWIFKKNIVKSRLRQILGINNSERIHARKCTIKEISPKLKNEFLNEYHIQGEDISKIKLGSFYNDELVSVMTFSKGNISKGSKSKEGIYELNRFCSNSNYHIPGIASKLLTYFQRNYEWKEIFSYADRRWSDGNVYKKIGFELDSITKPNYWYIKNLNRIHRFNLRKRPDEPKNITEWILRQKEGYHRIWDCGHYKFRIKNMDIYKKEITC